MINRELTAESRSVLIPKRLRGAVVAALIIFAVIAAQGRPGVAASRGCAQAPHASTESELSNASIIEMVKGGLSDAIIVNAIATQKGKFDVSPTGLISLKRSGVSDQVIQAMQSAASPVTARTPVNGASGQAAEQLPATPYWATVNTQSGTRPLSISPQSQVRIESGDGSVSESARDTAIASVILRGASEAASHVGVAMGTSAGMIPVVGGIISLGGLAAGKLFRREKKFWMANFLNGARAEFEVTTLRPELTAGFDDIPGIDPDAYTAVLRRVYSTPNNFRLVSKYQMTDKLRVKQRVEEIVPVIARRPSRGTVVLVPASDLVAGAEYILCIRPLSTEFAENVKLESSSDGPSTMTEFAFRTDSIAWDFRVENAAVTAPMSTGTVDETVGDPKPAEPRPVVASSPPQAVEATGRGELEISAPASRVRASTIRRMLRDKGTLLFDDKPSCLITVGFASIAVGATAASARRTRRQ